MMKKLLRKSFLLALLMAAGAGKGMAENYPVYFNKTISNYLQVNDTNKGDLTAKLNEYSGITATGKIYYESTGTNKGVLTLENASITSTTGTSVLSFETNVTDEIDITIKLIGTNSITNNSTMNNTMAMVVNNSKLKVTITGSGSLALTGSPSDVNSNAVTLLDGTLTFYDTTVSLSGKSYAIYGGGIEEGTLNFNASNVTFDSNIRMFKEITLTDCELPTGKSVDTYYGGKKGIDAATITKKQTLTATTVGSENWSSYYTGTAVKADANTTVYKAAQKDATTLTLTEIEGGVIPAGTAVVLKSTDASIALTGTTDAAADGAYDGNILKGSDEEQTVAAGDYYVLGDNSGSIGFMKYTGTTLAANKAYIPKSDLTGVSAPALSLDFGSGTTGIEAVAQPQRTEQGTYYDLSGRRVSNPKTGLYIVNGKKVIIK